MKKTVAPRYVAAILFVVIVVWMAVMGGPRQPQDHRLLLAISDLRDGHAWASRAGLAVTRLGTSLVLVPVGLAMVALAYRRGQRHGAVAAAIALALVQLTVEGIKALAMRARPGIDAHPVLSYGYSFPSAHATNSMATAVAAALLFAPAGSRRTWLVVAVAYGLLIGLTRPFLGVHWPSDVVAGWSIALAVMLVASQWIVPATMTSSGADEG